MFLEPSCEVSANHREPRDEFAGGLTAGSAVSNKRDLGSYAKPILVPTIGAVVVLSVAMETRGKNLFFW